MFPNLDLARMKREELILLISQSQREHNAFIQQAASRIEGFESQFAGLLQQNESLQRRHDGLLRENEDLRRQNDWLRRHLFGVLSERRILHSLSPAEQLWLDEQMLKPTEAAPPVATTVKAYERAQRRTPVDFVDADSKLKFDATVPVQVIEVPNPATEGLAEDEFERIGERCTYRLAQQRGPYVVMKYVQPVVKIKESGEVSCPSSPNAVIERSPADVSFLAGLVQDKFQFHLPLYRQHQRLEQSGIYLDRGSLTRLVHRVGELLEPVYHSVLSSVLQSAVLTMDESPTRAGRGNGRMKTGYFWALFGDQSEVAFLFSPSRSQKVVDEVLKGFQGKLVSDGYVVYETTAAQSGGTIIPVQCWSHTRRKFIEAEKLEPSRVKPVLDWIRRLYLVERLGRGDPERLLKVRQTYSRPLMEKIFDFLQKEVDGWGLLPSNPFLKAAAYALTRKAQLQVCLEDAAVPLDTNHIERALRPQAVGRKNWMFHVTEVGARYAAIFYTLIQSCLLCQVHPGTYLVDVLQRIDRHPAVEVHQLTPRLWKEHFSQNPLGSDLWI